jgi:oligopeptide/dipeptide ABC transporter ATP-binding protein
MTTAMDARPVLSVKDLAVEFGTPDGVVNAVNGVSFDLWPGETLAVVGESGSGKSVTAMSILGLIPQPPGRIARGQILFDGQDLLAMPRSELRRIRGSAIAMVFQDPMTSLNPVLKVGFQVAETIVEHARVAFSEARRLAVGLLKEVRVPSPEDRFHQYPHQFSGGMRQRALIAMAIANRPRVIIADEPTTALDVTIQAQIFETLRNAQARTGAAMILITHDLGLVAELADRVMVMYAGRVVETADVRSIFRNPRHPYTQGLLKSLPTVDRRRGRLTPIPGAPPSLIALPPGCPFQPRCDRAAGRAICVDERPTLAPLGDGRHSACHFAAELNGAAEGASAA